MTDGVQALHRFGHDAMNTTFEVVVRGQEQTYARQAAQTVFREIDHLETLLSRFDPGSDISQINRLRPGESVRVGIDVFECLQCAIKIHADTAGAFDITVGPLMNCLREAKGNWAKIRPEELAAARARMGVDRLVLNPADFSVTVTQAVEVDLGAIGKGFALDKATEILADWSIVDALVHCGPSTALALGSGGSAGGCPAGKQGWAVGVGADWGKAAGVEAVLLHNESVSGSGTEVQGHHVLDPRTGAPATSHVAAWAVAPTAALSDALSTAFMVMSTVEVKAFCAAPPEVGALVVGKRRGVMRLLGDKVVATKGMLGRRIGRPQMDTPVAVE